MGAMRFVGVAALACGVAFTGYSLISGQQAVAGLDADEAAMLRDHPLPGSKRGAAASIANTVARFGLDPYRILPLAVAAPASGGAGAYLVLLRNQSEVVLIDGALATIDRTPVPRSPTGWDLVDGRYLFVGGELSNVIQIHEVDATGIRLRSTITLNGVGSVRDIDVVGQDVFALDGLCSCLLRLTLPPHWRDHQGALEVQRADFEVGAGPLQVTAVGDFLLVNSLLAHELSIVPLTEDGPDFDRAATVQHDGPLWAFDAIEQDGSLLLALAGVENRTLDRTGGEFGYIDSFVFLYRVPVDHQGAALAPGTPELVDLLNVSEHGIVTPKVVRFEGAERLRVIGFGSEGMALIEATASGLSVVQTAPAPPGITDYISDGERVVAVSTLLDRVVTTNGPGWLDWRYFSIVFEGRAVLGEPHNGHAVDVRLGEALLFTTLFSPENRTKNELSRFTCETCHFEGTFDGRTHFTGREDVFATTKTLRGMANNVPLFSRAGDQSLSSMIVAEFRVANQGRHALFEIELEDHPWLAEIGVTSTVDPADQRRALLAFLIDYTHPPNPWVAQGRRLDEDAIRGLGIFRERCATCHQVVSSTRETGDLVFSFALLLDLWRLA